jgi:spore maturation protein CgeB
MKKIILVAGDLDPNKSYEFHNFLKPLEKMGNDVIPFDFMKILLDSGREKMNLKLLSFVKEHLPDMVIFIPQTDEFIPEIIDDIGKHTQTLGYFYDDMWRIKYSRFWANHYNFVTTSDIDGVKKFKEVGHTNVIYSPFSCNTEIYCKKNLPKLYDVSFVGGYSPRREWYINYLKKEDINVKVWGNGWKSKMLSSEDMINVFNQSRINLNLSNNICWDIRYLFDFNRSFKKTLHIWKSTFLTIFKSDIKTVEQVKGRHFEINACGGFQLSYNVNGLDKLYNIDEEIALFYSPEDLVKKIKYYLKHEDERELIASHGLNRTSKEHTMEKRFHFIIEQMKKLQTNK